VHQDVNNKEDTGILTEQCKTNKPLVYPDKRFTFYTTKKESTKERNSELYPKPPEGGSEFIPVHAMD